MNMLMMNTWIYVDVFNKISPSFITKEGQSGMYPPDLHFDLTRTDDNVL